MNTIIIYVSLVLVIISCIYSIYLNRKINELEDLVIASIMKELKVKFAEVTGNKEEDKEFVEKILMDSEDEDKENE